MKRIARLLPFLWLAVASTGSADTVTWDFGGNSAQSSSSQDLTGSVVGDNRPEKPSSTGPDAGIGADTCGTGQCKDDEACLCAKFASGPDLNNFLELTVACRENDGPLFVDPVEIRFDAAATAAARTGRVQIFASDDAYASFVNEAGTPVTSTGFTTVDADLSGLDPKPFWALRLHPRDNLDNNQDARMRIDNLVVEANCLTEDELPGAAPSILATGTVTTSFNQRRVELEVANTKGGATVNGTLTIVDEMGNARFGTPTAVSVSPGEIATVSSPLNTATESFYGTFETTDDTDNVRLRIHVNDPTGGSNDGSEGN